MILVGGSVLVIAGAAIGGTVAGYNLRKTTGDKILVLPIPAVSPSQP